MECPPPPSRSPDRSIALMDLNADALAHCASFLSLRDVSNLAVTCKYLCRVAYSDAVWRRLLADKWPHLCVPSGVEGVRDKYLARHTAVNQLKFSDPLEIISPQLPIPHSHILLNKNHAFLAQGSIIQKMRLDSPNAEGQYHEALMGHNARITCMRLVPINDTYLFRSEMQNEDQVLITSSSDRTIRLWWKGRSHRCFKGHNGPVTTMADKLLGDCGSKLLASGGEDCTVRLWSVGLSGKHHPLAMTYHGHEKPVTLLSVARHKASLLVSMSSDSRVRVWDTISTSSSSSSSCVGMTSIHGAPVGMKCHDTLCYIAAGSSVSAIDLRTMQKVFTAAVHLPKIYSFEMLPSKWLICTGGENKAMLWDIRRNQVKPEPVAELEPCVGRVTMLHMDSYKIVAGGPFDHHINVWETDTGLLANQLDCRLPGESDDIVGLSAMAVDGCRIITSGCTEGPGIVYFRDFTDCLEPLLSSPDQSSSSKFWEPQQIPHDCQG